MLEAVSIIISKYHHDDRYEGRGTQYLNVKSMTRDIILQSYFCILDNVDEVQPYISTHRRLTKKKYLWISDKWLLKEDNKNFISWFDERISNDGSASETIKWMSYMPKFNIVTWTIYAISNFFIYTKPKYDHCIMKNSGVMVKTESMYSQVRNIRIL